VSRGTCRVAILTYIQMQLQTVLCYYHSYDMIVITQFLKIS